jgi:hypothetical protein
MEMISTMSKVIELRLKEKALRKKLEQIEAELELLYFEIDEEQEKSLT